MYDVMVATADGAATGARAADALRAARMRVIAVNANAGALPGAFRVDVGVACASEPASVPGHVAAMRGALAGPPPIVAVVPRIAGPEARAAGASDVLPENTSEQVLVLRVQRAASEAERARARVVMHGTLAGTGLDDLVAAVARRWPLFLVRLRAGALRGEVSVREGVTTHARVDGVAPGEAAEALARWTDAEFEVLAEGEPYGPDQKPTQRPPALARRAFSTAPAVAPGAASEPSSAARRGAGASREAHAVALLNAVAAYARVWLSPRVVASTLRASLAAQARDVAGDRPVFDVDDEGAVVLARAGDGPALRDTVARWVPGFFAQCAVLAPSRFDAARRDEVLDGLRAMAEPFGLATGAGAATDDQGGTR